MDMQHAVVVVTISVNVKNRATILNVLARILLRNPPCHTILILHSTTMKQYVNPALKAALVGAVLFQSCFIHVLAATVDHWFRFRNIPASWRTGSALPKGLV